MSIGTDDGPSPSGPRDTTHDVPHTAVDEAANATTSGADRGSLRALLPPWVPRSDLIHLVYLSNLWWQPFFAPDRGWRDWAIVAAIVVAYVPLYILGHNPDHRSRWRSLVATIVLGTVATLFNVGASVLFVYAAAQAAWTDRGRVVQWQAGLTGLCAVLAVASPIVWPYRLYGLLPSVVFLWLIGWMVRGDVQAHEHTERLRIDNVRIEQLATANERERIARDLHDLVGQTLTALAVKAQLVQTLVDTDAVAARTHAADLEAGARDALAQVRTAIDGLGEVSLRDELHTARRTLGAAGVELAIDADPTGSTPGPLVERILALAVREATTNVVRHARAQHCHIAFGRHDEHWQLLVADDGRGGTDGEGNGLRGMHERVVAIGGSMDRDGSAGTRITVRVPA